MIELIITLISGTVVVGVLMVLLAHIFSEIVRRIYNKPIRMSLIEIESFSFNGYYDRKFGVLLYNRYKFVYDFNNRPIKFIRLDVKDYIPK